MSCEGLGGGTAAGGGGDAAASDLDQLGDIFSSLPSTTATQQVSIALL